MSGKRLGWFGKPLAKNAPSSWNPVAAVLPTPTPTPLPLSKEYIYAGSRLLAVEDANAVAAPPADIAVWRVSAGSGTWYVMGQTGSANTSMAWGGGSDIPVPGDYDGDGKTDFSIYRPSTGVWWIFYSSTSTYDGINYGGTAGDIPVAADFDGDGMTDLGIARADLTNSEMDWYVDLSGGGYLSMAFGDDADVPNAADFDGDGKADIGVYRESNGNFYYDHSSDANYTTAYIGASTLNCSPSWKCAVSSDYDGDGKADPAIYKESTAYWYIFQSTTNSLVSMNWGSSGNFPVQNDYDGDGKTDLAVFDNANPATWTIKRSSNGSTRTESYGTTNDIPVPAFYRR